MGQRDFRFCLVSILSLQDEREVKGKAALAGRLSPSRVFPVPATPLGLTAVDAGIGRADVRALASAGGARMQRRVESDPGRCAAARRSHE